MSSPGRYLRRSLGPIETHVAIGVPLVGVLLSEALVLSGRVQLALGGHLLTLLACTLGPLWLRDELPVFQAFVLLPVFRLVSLAMPVFVELTLYWFPFVYGPFIPAVLLLARESDAVDLQFGWKTAVVALPITIVMGAVLAEVEYGIIRPPPLVPSVGLEDLAVLTVVMVVFVGAVEELLFRGLLQRTFGGKIGRWPGVLLAAGLFATMHAGYGLLAEVGFAFSLGLLLGVVYEWTDSLALVVVFHGVLNVFLFGIVPTYGPLFPVA